MTVSRGKNAAFTLVEMLVVIAILGTLMALLLPAISSVRESMRRAQCKNNLKQIGNAAQAHFAAQGYFPSSGWGWTWTGDPDHGFGARQPGGWIYNCLPYLGLDMIHDKAKGQSGADKYNIWIPETIVAAIPVVICPTRRKVMVYTWDDYFVNANAGAAGGVSSKTDYAGNMGQFFWESGGNNGPPTLDGPNFSSSCFTTFPNCHWANPPGSTQITSFNGVTCERSQVSQIPDGQSNVFLAGEKYIMADQYYTAHDYGNDGSALQGHDGDINRSVEIAPLRDTPGVNNDSFGFGSAHATGLHFVFCDGHVRLLSYQINFTTYQTLGIRNALVNGATLDEDY